MKTVRYSLSMLLVLALASCATLDESADTESASAPSSAEPQLATTAEDLAEAAELGEQESSEEREAVVYKGTDRVVRLPAKEEAVRFLGDDVSLNFEQAPLSEVTHAIMGDILKLDYVVDHQIQGQVTLRTRTPIPRDQLLNVLESLLKANNTIMIRDSDGRYLVTGVGRGTKLNPTVSNAGNSAAGYSTIIVPLRYISANNMAEILRPVAEESAFVRIDTSRNLLMLAGTRSQLDGWLDIVSTFDVDQLQGMSVGLFPLENSSVEEVNTALETLLSSEGSNLKDLIRVVPVERLNSILIVTPRSHYLDTVQEWIKRLDEAHYSELSQRLFVYPVQNTTASRLADLINSLYMGQSSPRQNNQGVGDAGGVAPGLTSENLGSTRSGSLSNSSFRTRSSTRNTGRSAAATTSSSSISMDAGGGLGGAEMVGDVRVVADEENNSLMIFATAMQYRIIEAALKQLDVVATQVMIEASIVEVTLTDELSYGLEWNFKNSLGSDYSGTGFLSSIEGANSPASIVPGFSYTITNSAAQVSAVLNALAKESLLNIISTPSVMVLDNHEAYIHVGQQVPIIDSQTESLATDNDRVTQSISYRDTGVKLTVKPSVNAGGLVTMDVEQSVTDVGPIDDASGQRRFLERNIQSRVAVRSGEPVVLGGLIRENSGTASQGVPFLHSIPVVGSLFGTDTDTTDRTELLVIITPKAIYNESELRDVSKELRSRIRNLDLIEPETGPL
ncbi:type II secretion system protein GspD [Halioglobus japonicus]|uniref:Type II secretion system protein GspD n=1 Tax=Halioglobus japonicus TaxID=930805 RepID=A0AAP8MF50_9GAMM|nr:type II secretion system secretin GspD [Halioglobus japonicus]AQA18285.1 type II secretion system protein GspD [Halioglobus japonicus]PLW86299.1 type II secretion system protein GspD [Halioglobus japonicus]